MVQRQFGSAPSPLLTESKVSRKAVRSVWHRSLAWNATRGDTCPWASTSLHKWRWGGPNVSELSDGRYATFTVSRGASFARL